MLTKVYVRDKYIKLRRLCLFFWKTGKFDTNVCFEGLGKPDLTRILLILSENWYPRQNKVLML
jgi:hypothetical protein